MFVKSEKIFTSSTALTAVLIYILAMSNFAAAQDDTQERLLACDRISNAEERLDCFNAVVGGIKGEVEPSSNIAKTVEAPAVLAAPESTAVETIPEVPAAIVLEDQANKPAAAPAVDETVEASTAAPATAESDFGLEDQQARAARQAERERKKEVQDEAVYSTIVEVRRVTGGRFEARLENGQVWRETEATRTVRRPKAGDAVRITSGRLGSYRMKFNDDNRLASVRRMQ